MGSASNYDDETDGILTVMNDVPSGTPVHVLIPEGGGSGPNGEYVVFEIDAHSSYYGNSGASIKVDRSDVRFTGLGHPTVTVNANDDCHTVLVSSFAGAGGRYATTQIGNIHINSLFSTSAETADLS